MTRLLQAVAWLTALLEFTRACGGDPYDVLQRGFQIMHASSFAARFMMGCAHHADVMRVPQDCESLRFPPPILPSAMIVLESCGPGGAFYCSEDAHESRMSVRQCRP
jgi:hypothetical protein